VRTSFECDFVRRLQNQGKSTGTSFDVMMKVMLVGPEITAPTTFISIRDINRSKMYFFVCCWLLREYIFCF